MLLFSSELVLDEQEGRVGASIPVLMNDRGPAPVRACKDADLNRNGPSWAEARREGGVRPARLPGRARPEGTLERQ